MHAKPVLSLAKGAVECRPAGRPEPVEGRARLTSRIQFGTARLIVRDLVNASVGFEALAAATARPAKSRHRMLSEKGNPSMDNLAATFAVRKRLGVDLRAHAVEAS